MIDNLLVDAKPDEISSHFICRRCGERVERGMFNTTPHMTNECELRDVIIWSHTFNWVAPVSNRRIGLYKRKEIINRVEQDLLGADHPRIRRPVRIRITRRSQRAADYDSVAIGGKYFIDRLTDFKIIGGDRPIHLGGHVKVEYVPEVGQPATKIEILELPGHQLAEGVEEIFRICEFGAYETTIEAKLIMIGMDRKQAKAAIKAARLCGLKKNIVLSKPNNLFYE